MTPEEFLSSLPAHYTPSFCAKCREIVERGNGGEPFSSTLVLATANHELNKTTTDSAAAGNEARFNS